MNLQVINNKSGYMHILDSETDTVYRLWLSGHKDYAHIEISQWGMIYPYAVTSGLHQEHKERCKPFEKFLKELGWSGNYCQI